MKVAILAGGKGTRLAEETSVRPKPMVEIGGMPILWHIMMIYSHYGYNDFSVALGYKGDYIKRYFAEYGTLAGSITVNMGRPDPVVRHDQTHAPWSVDLIETGDETLTGGRVKRLQPHIGNETFMLTWGDGVSNVNLDKLLAFHRSHGKLATITAVRPPARYGHMRFDGDQVTAFEEKPQTAEGWINGAFFVLEPPGVRLHRWRHGDVRTCAAGEPGPGRPADGLSPRGLLGGDGHAARQTHSAKAVEFR